MMHQILGQFNWGGIFLTQAMSSLLPRCVEPGADCHLWQLKNDLRKGKFVPFFHHREGGCFVGRNSTLPSTLKNCCIYKSPDRALWTWVTPPAEFLQLLEILFSIAHASSLNQCQCHCRKITRDDTLHHGCHRRWQSEFFHGFFTVRRRRRRSSAWFCPEGNAKLVLGKMSPMYENTLSSACLNRINLWRVQNNTGEA